MELKIFMANSTVWTIDLGYRSADELAKDLVGQFGAGGEILGMHLHEAEEAPKPRQQRQRRNQNAGES